MDHLPEARLAAPHPTEAEAAHLAACARCRVEARRMSAFLLSYTEPAAADPVAAVRAEPVGRYADLGLVARGAMGEVRRVRDADFGRVVAMKLARPRDATLTDSLAARFLREAQVTARLQHPAIAPVHELGRRPDGTCYYTMRLVPGGTLADALLGCRDLPDRLRLLPAFAVVCHAMAYAHSQGVVHRDLKPANILAGAFGDTVVLDWGLAKIVGETDDLLPMTSGEGTLVGTVLGTPGYMSPEQARGELDRIDARSDVWALGAILFELLTGRRPVVGEVADTLARTALGEIPPVRALAPDAPVDLAAVADKALSADPADRYPDAKALAADIDAWTAGARVSAHPYTVMELFRRVVGQNRLASAGVVALFALAGASYFQVRWERDAKAVALAAAREANEIARDRLVAHYLATGTARVEAGDALGALPWFAAVLERVDDDPVRGPDARIRLAAILDRAPALIGVWATAVPPGELALSGDGAWLATVSGAEVVYWPTGDGVGSTFSAPEDVLGLALSSDGSRLAWAGRTHAGVVDRATRAPIGPVVDLPSSSWRNLRFSGDGRRVVVSGGCLYPAEMWDVETGRFADVPGAPCDVNAAGRLAVFGTRDNAMGWSVRFADDAAALEIREYAVRTEPAGNAERVAISTGGDVRTGSATVQVFNARGRPVSPPLPHAHWAIDLALDAAGETLATVTMGGAAAVWDVTTGRARTTLPASGRAGAVEISGDGQTAAVLATDGIVRLWRLPSDPAMRYDVVQATPTAVGSPALGLTDTGGWRVFEAGEPVGPAFDGIGNFGLSNDGKYVAVVRDGGVAVRPVATDGAGTWHAGRIRWAGWSPAGHTYALGIDDEVAVYDAASGARVSGPFPASLHGTLDNRWSPDGRELAGVEGSNLMRRDAATGQPIGQPIAIGEGAVSYLPTGDGFFTLACPGHAGRACALGFDGAIRGATLPAADVEGFAVNPTATLVTLARNGGELRTFGLAKGDVRSPAFGHPTAGLAGFAYTEDGRHLVTTNWGDSAPRIWNPLTGEQIARLPSSCLGCVQSSGSALVVPGMRAEDRPVAELTRLAELLAGFRLGATGATALTPAECVERWEAPRALPP